MAFVNEYIPEEDFKKYNFEELNCRPSFGTTPCDDWTIDRSENVWLREFYSETDHTAPDGGWTGVSVFDFYWKGYLMSVKLKILDHGGDRGKHCWARKKILSMNIPEELREKRAMILDDLKNALTAYKDGGVLSSASSYTLTLDI